MKEKDFRDYYGTFYVPANMTVIAVGDCAMEPVAAAIRAAFADGPAAPRPASQDAGVHPYQATRAIVAVDPELTARATGSPSAWVGARLRDAAGALVPMDFVACQDPCDDHDVCWESFLGGVQPDLRSLADRVLEAGTYEVEIEDGAGRTHRRTVEILPGEVTRLAVDLLPR